MDIQPDPPKMLSTAQVAHDLGMSQRRVIALLNEGRLTGICHGGHYWEIHEESVKNLTFKKPAGWPKGKPRKPTRAITLTHEDRLALAPLLGITPEALMQAIEQVKANQAGPDPS